MGDILISAARKFLPGFLKFVLMLIILSLIASQVSWNDYEVVGESGEILPRPGLVSSLVDFRAVYFIIALSIQFFGVICTGLRWRILLSAQNIMMDRTSVLRLTFLGEFFNHLFPGAMGGELAKAYYVIRHTGKKGAALVSVFANRFVGLAAMTFSSILILLFLLVAEKSVVETLNETVYAIFVVGTAITVFIYISLNSRIYASTAFKHLLDRIPFNQQIDSLRQALYRYRRPGIDLGFVMILSLLIVLFSVTSVMFVGLSLDVSIPWYIYFIYIPLITIMTAIPVTPGGVGVFEELFLFFFATDADLHKILMMALLCRLVMVAWAIPGAVIFLGSKRISREEISHTVGEFKVSDCQ